ncbi:hypothetical protein niasHS_012544 [Heterodera schachtii]|uniref:Uncharacterized protein n=1 Tax=Heterodera schachtii TaxID=97005 RepID=A0ABD2I6H3_HETSC
MPKKKISHKLNAEIATRKELADARQKNRQSLLCARALAIERACQLPPRLRAKIHDAKIFKNNSLFFDLALSQFVGSIGLALFDEQHQQQDEEDQNDDDCNGTLAMSECQFETQMIAMFEQFERSNTETMGRATALLHSVSAFANEYLKVVAMIAQQNPLVYEAFFAPGAAPGPFPWWPPGPSDFPNSTIYEHLPHPDELADEFPDEMDGAALLPASDNPRKKLAGARYRLIQLARHFPSSIRVSLRDLAAHTFNKPKSIGLSAEEQQSAGATLSGDQFERQLKAMVVQYQRVTDIATLNRVTDFLIAFYRSFYHVIGTNEAISQIMPNLYHVWFNDYRNVADGGGTLSDQPSTSQQLGFDQFEELSGEEFFGDPEVPSTSHQTNPHQRHPPA